MHEYARISPPTPPLATSPDTRRQASVRRAARIVGRELLDRQRRITAEFLRSLRQDVCDDHHRAVQERYVQLGAVMNVLEEELLDGGEL